MTISLSTKILSAKDIDVIKDKINILLSTKGVKVDHPKALKLLKKAGAQVSDADNTVCFPKELIEEALKQVPDNFTLAGIDSKYDLAFPHPQNSFYTRTCTGGMNYYREDGEYQSITLKEVEEWTRLSNALEHIDFCSIPSTTPKDVPAETLDIHTLKTILNNSLKHTWIQPYEAANIEYLIELAAALVGGKDELSKRPIVSFISCSSTPLEYKYMDLEVILQCCLHRIPIHACSLPTAGANAPITLQGTVLMASTEVLALIIITQLIAPGTPVIATPLLFSMDMLSTYTLQSPIEVTKGRMAAMQLFAEGYGTPTHTYGTGTDSFLVDGQSMIERTSITQMVALSGAFILGGAGQIEVAKTISPIQLIIDNDIFGMTKKLKSGFEISDDTLAWDEVLNLTGREGFLEMEHTFRHFRDTFRPKTFSRDSRPVWVEKGSKDIINRATELYQTIRSDYETVSISQEVLQEMDKITKSADENIIGK